MSKGTPSMVVETKEEALQRALTKAVKAKEELEREFVQLQRRTEHLEQNITSCRADKEQLGRELRIHQDYQHILANLVGGRF